MDFNEKTAQEEGWPGDWKVQLNEKQKKLQDSFADVIEGKSMFDMESQKTNDSKTDKAVMMVSLDGSLRMLCYNLLTNLGEETYREYFIDDEFTETVLTPGLYVVELTYIDTTSWTDFGYESDYEIEYKVIKTLYLFPTDLEYLF